MQITKAVAIGVLSAVIALVSSTARAEVQITIHNGRVTLVARDATLRQILAEWARVGQTKIVNIERIKELQPLFHGEYAVILRNGIRLTLSRSHREKLNRLLGRTP